VKFLAQKNIMEILTKHEITGYTTYEVNGNGARGIRGQGLQNEKNIKIEIILREEKLQDIVEEVSRTLFANFAIVLYVSDVGVLRTEKF
jgi:Nitrogen regulatory protein P-II.